MRRLFATAAAGLLAAAVLLPQRADAISARYACVMDGVTGELLFEKQPDTPALIASTTKIMTALLICEQCNVLDRMRIPPEAVGIEGSSMYLREGEVLTLQELLYGLMLSSGNDAATALAIYCGGTVEGFAQLMNRKAELLGLRGTHFENPSGLDAPGHRSTARDLAVLAAYAMENPIFRQTVSTKTVRIGERQLTNHNKLLWRLEGAQGVKTGYTRAAGRILVSAAQREGRRLVAVTMDAPDDWRDHCALLEEAFSRYEKCPVVTRGQQVDVLEIAGGQGDRVQILAAADFFFPLREGESPRLMLPGPGFAYAPAVEGADAGFAYVLLRGNAVGKVPVVYGQTVEQKQEESSFLERILQKLPGD